MLALVAGLLPACGSSGPQRGGMAYIPAGEFAMGSAADDQRVYDWEKPHEQPQHPVVLKAFFMDVREVTNAEYEAFDRTHRRNERFSSCDTCPVTEVSWFDAKRYCEQQRPQKRLPTEAEWEKAAKGGSTHDPEPLEEYAWFAKNTIEHAQPVGQKRPNGYGLHDVLGNVREWTADWYGPDYYAERVRENPTGPADGGRKVERGGAFFLPARGVTTTIRYNHPPHFKLYFLGFRCAADVR